MSDDPFHQQLTTHLAALRRYAFVLARGTEEAEDLLQDCLTKAVASASQWQPGSDLRAWLFRILYTCHISRQRRRQVQARIMTDMDGADAAQPPDQMARVEAGRVLEALDRLPDAQRQAILAVAIDDLRYEEAARRLGIPIGTFMSRIARGREALRKVLDASAKPALRLVKGGGDGR